MTKDILLVGFGALGAIYSHILKKSGQARLTAVARSNYEPINRDGMHIKSKKYGDVKNFKPDRLVRSVAEAADRSYSYVVVTTKAVPEVLRTSKILAPLLAQPYAGTHEQPTYVLLQNGINVEKDLYAALNNLDKGTPRIISTAVWIGANLLEANVVEHNDFDRVSMGIHRPDDYTTTQNSEAEQAILDDFGSILKDGGSDVTIVPEIQRVKYRKNMWNVVLAGVATLTGYRLPSMFRAPPGQGQSYEPYVAPQTRELIESFTHPMMYAMMDELTALGRALGFPDSPEGLPASAGADTIANTIGLHIRPDSTHTPSMLLDASLEKPMEVEVVLGEVVRLAREKKVDIPRIETMYGLLLVKQNQILRKSA